MERAAARKWITCWVAWQFEVANLRVQRAVEELKSTSMRSASASSPGLPNTSPSSTTAVSAPRTTVPGAVGAAATVCAVVVASWATSPP